MPQSPPRSRSGRILVVDDEPSMRHFLEEFLGGQGHRVTCATTPEEALAILDREPFDLILSDIMLGGGNGITLLQNIRNRQPDCPVIMITGFPNIDSATEALRLGAFDYLAKPIRLAPLEKITRQALETHHLRQEHRRIQKNLHALFHGVRDALFLIDAQGILQEANQAAAQVCHIEPSAIGTLPFAAMLGNCSGGCLATVRQTLDSGIASHVPRLECVMAEGPIQVNEITVTPVLEKENMVNGAVLVVHNRTYLVNLEQSLGKRQQFHRLVGKSPKMLELYDLIEQLGTVNTTVLLTGESGTGKELVAEAIHRQRPDCDSVPLVKVNCAALSEQLLESELFGHVKGAFTGAIRTRIGRFERANHGTLFLDEIGDISTRMQLQLLRVLQEREFERVGDSTPIKVHFRLIVATNQNLEQKVRAGTFREDLFHRLNVVNPRLPALRERPEDIPLLVRHFLDKFNHQFNKKIDTVSAGLLRRMLNHSWPGNVRELENTMEHAALLCNGTTLFLSHLPSNRFDVVDSTAAPVTNESPPPPAIPAAGQLIGERLRKEHPGPEEILRALELARGNRTRAAQFLGISRRTFYRILDRIKGQSSVSGER
ncbi:MAG: sigma 54-interacting transcriptional regulator [Magnetococcales bacterium]|nr:sigma 54-interacting transcriptional regulator [Magnetococcales bacterium]